MKIRLLAIGLFSLAVGGCGQPAKQEAAKDWRDSVGAPAVGPSVVEYVNINTNVVTTGGHRLIAQEMGDAISQVAERLKAGEIKPTKETKWAQFYFKLQHSPSADSQLSIATLRVPLAALRAAPERPGVDFRPFLDLVDHVERGPDFDAASKFCGSNAEAGKGLKFCEAVAAGK
ncbi:hypothetical protein [Asticcacaulis solisilvae]|uniref:hypothetical protein n=1 Tax=Asticcacaulis solisilvae TaxID=1217274 RepID=UPI003FD6F2CD